jgi:sugar lactone lactonase YvrE
MPSANYLPEVLETAEAERLATGFIFIEGPLWHPGGYWYFVDLRQNKLFRLTPGQAPELVRTTIGGNGTTFDSQSRLILCEGDDRHLTRSTLVPTGHPVHRLLRRCAGRDVPHRQQRRDFKSCSSKVRSRLP